MNDIMDGHNMRVLSIDAWSNGEDTGWDWNAWYTVGTVSQETFECCKDYVQWFIDEGYVNSRYLYDIDDDGYNIVICNRETCEPLFAIEYGNCY